MTHVEHASDLQTWVGRTLGTSDWVEIDRDRVRGFAEITGDKHWIHLDGERVRRETPYSDALAHGFLLAALLTDLGAHCLHIEAATQWLNYGMDGLRFVSPVPVGSHVRLVQTLKALDLSVGRRAKIRVGCVLELSGAEKPALVAERIMVALW